MLSWKFGTCLFGAIAISSGCVIESGISDSEAVAISEDTLVSCEIHVGSGLQVVNRFVLEESDTEQYDVVAGVKVRLRVSADGTTWRNVQETTSDDNGNFEFDASWNTSSCPSYVFVAIEVQYEDDELEIRYQNATSNWLGDNSPWYTVLAPSESDAFQAVASTGSTRNILLNGSYWFQPMGEGESAPIYIAYNPCSESETEEENACEKYDEVLTEEEEFDLWASWSYASLWVTYKEVISHMDSIGFGFRDQVVVKYPHDSAATESDLPYTNPATHIIYIHCDEDGSNDWFNYETVVHELMHLWAYQYSTGELVLAADLAEDQDTHNWTRYEASAFHEGFAEFAMGQLVPTLFNHDYDDTPLSRWGVENKIDDIGNDGESIIDTAAIATEMALDGEFAVIDNLDDLWQSTFQVMVLQNVQRYTWEAEETDVSQLYLLMRNCTTSPWQLTLEDVLEVFPANAAAGFPDDLDNEEMTTEGFLTRAQAILGSKLSSDQLAAMLTLLDPEETAEPHELLECSSKSTSTLPF